MKGFGKGLPHGHGGMHKGKVKGHGGLSVATPAMKVGPADKGGSKSGGKK